MQILLELPWWPKDTPWAFVAWSPFSPHEIHCFRWLDAEKPFQDDPIVPVMCFRMPHSHQRVEPGDNVEEQFPVKVSSNCPCWVHKLCYSSWLMAQAMHRVWVFCCALISTMPLGSNIHADILRPYMRAQCGDFGGRSPARLWHVSVWRLMEVGGAVWKTFSIHFQVSRCFK